MSTVKSPTDKVVAKIKELPPMPVVVQKLLSVVGNEDSSADDVSEVLATDQALTGKVLKLVNSSFYGLSREISTISRAVVILGYAAVRNLAVGLSAYESLKKAEGAVDWEAFWEHALHSAAGAQALSKRFGFDEPEEAFIAGLLHDVGVLVLSIAFPDQFAVFCNEPEDATPEREQEAFGMTHSEAGIRLLEHWRLPDPLCRVARFHHSVKLASSDKEPLLTAVILADMLAALRDSSPFEPTNEDGFSRVLDATDMSLADCGAVLADVNRRVHEARAFLNIAEPGGDRGRPDTDASHEAAVVVIAKHAERAAWLRALVPYLGYTTAPLDALTNSRPSSPPVALVILDPEELDAERLGKLGIVLEGLRVPTAVLEAAPPAMDRLPATLKASPRLRLAFSWTDVTPLLQGA